MTNDQFDAIAAINQDRSPPTAAQHFTWLCVGLVFCVAVVLVSAKSKFLLESNWLDLPTFFSGGFVETDQRFVITWTKV